MLAETAFSVFQALSPQEQARMLSMVNVPIKPSKRKKAVKPISDKEVREMILSKLIGFSQNYKNKKAHFSTK